MTAERHRKLPVPDHQAHPLRRIIRREMQNGQPFVILECNHASPGVPESRTSRFYPCPICAEAVEHYRRTRQA